MIRLVKKLAEKKNKKVSEKRNQQEQSVRLDLRFSVQSIDESHARAIWMVQPKLVLTLGRQDTQNYRLAGKTAFAYTPGGQLASLTDAESRVTSYIDDDVGSKPTWQGGATRTQDVSGNGD